MLNPWSSSPKLRSLSLFPNPVVAFPVPSSPSLMFAPCCLLLFPSPCSQLLSAARQEAGVIQNSESKMASTTSP